MNTTLNKHILSILLLFSFFCANAQEEIAFLENEYDFGTINVKDKSAFHRFVFKNNGTTPLVVKSVYGRCSCIDAVWTKNPVLPGDTGSVVVRYSIYSSGAFNKKVKVVTNKKNTFLKVFGTVKK